MADENVFISWSGDRSRRVAHALYEFLPDCIQAVRPWASFESIEAGRRWNAEITAVLSTIQIGVIVVTPENIEKPWLLFESGALARQLNETARVCPYLVGLTKSQLQSPLADFQALVADEAETFSMVSSIGAAVRAPIDQQRLRRAFDAAWPRLNERIKAVIAENPPKPPPKRTSEEIKLERLTALVERVDGRIGGTPTIQDSRFGTQDPRRDTKIAKYLLEELRRQGQEIRSADLLRWLESIPEKELNGIVLEGPSPARLWQIENLVRRYLGKEVDEVTTVDGAINTLTPPRTRRRTPSAPP